jgi:hypothetical protein
MVEIVCANVGGGWQTEVKATGFKFGPVFNKITDLWQWQRTALFAALSPIKSV